MKQLIHTSAYLLIGIFIFSACEFDYDVFNPSTGQDDIFDSINWGYYLYYTDPRIKTSIEVHRSHDDSLELNGYLKYDSILVVDHMVFYYHPEGQDDSVSLVRLTTEPVTIDLPSYADSTFAVSATIPFDSTRQNDYCFSVSIDRNKNPGIQSNMQQFGVSSCTMY